MIGHRDGIVFAHAYGQRAIVPTPETMTLDTIFDLASLTKPFTATLLMQLVARGRVALDAPAATYLPELQKHGHAAITVRQLLVHTAGLAAENPLGDYEHGRDAALAAIFASRQLTPAGSRFHYSDLDYVVLGALIERVTGEPLEQLAGRELFTPLGMHDTGFRPAPALRPRIAPTEIPDDVRKRIDVAARTEPVIRGDVHDPRAFLLGGVAGNAGVFTTARDLSRFAQAMLAGGALEGTRVLDATTLATMTTPQFLSDGDTVRALGWDMQSEYSGLRGKRLSYRAFGHGGFTGTSLWIDPEQDLFVILLSNRVHPHGKGHVIKLAGELADLAAERFGRALEPAGCDALAGHVETGIDVLRAQGFALLAGKRIGVVANDASRAHDGARTIDLLHDAPGVHVVSLFAPEHGLDHAREGAVADTTDDGSALTVHSLYGKTRKPTAAMLHGLDAIVFDLQDVGVRFFTYASTLRGVLEACSKANVAVFVLDRPDPLGAARVDGPMPDDGHESFVNYHALPLIHGMTLGELARMLNEERHLNARLTVIDMRGYARELSFGRTGQPWSAPSPNLPTLDALELYPALALIEGTNVSVGRGTDRPFGVVGAPWIDASALLRRLSDGQLPGISLSVVDFTPTRDRYAGQLCHGLSLQVVDHRRFQALRTGFTLAAALLSLHREAFRAGEMSALIGHTQTMDALLAGAPFEQLARGWLLDLMRFSVRRARFLAYPSCDARPLVVAPAKE